jgi:two-component system NarL family response regulator
MSDDTISVFIIDDNRPVREALSAMLNQLPDMRAVSATVDDAFAFAVSKPQVLLLDAGLRDHDSLRVATVLKRDSPDTKVVVMDLLPVNEDIVEFVNAGVSGFVLKDRLVAFIVTHCQRVWDRT